MDIEKAGIVIVEDEYLIAASIKIAAERAGFKVLGIAADMTSALKLCEETSPLFATMDLNLAGDSNGVEVAQELEMRFSVPSLFVSAYSEDRSEVTGSLKSSLGWVDKPFVTRVLQEHLETALEKVQARTSG